MKSATQVADLLAEVQKPHVTCLPHANNMNTLAEAVCAFANDMSGTGEPGYLIIGADDAGRVVGLDISDRLLQQLSALRSQGNILPIPALEVYKVAMADGDVAVVEVQPAILPPVRFKGRVYIRVGPGRAIASEHEERILTERRVSNTLTFDASPAHGNGLDDLSRRLFEDYRRAVIDPEVIAANHRTYSQQLASLRCLDPATTVPTYGGLALFSRGPRRFMPGAYTQFLRFDGTDVAQRPVDQAEIDGDLPTALASQVRKPLGLTRPLHAPRSVGDA